MASPEPGPGNGATTVRTEERLANCKLRCDERHGATCQLLHDLSQRVEGMRKDLSDLTNVVQNRTATLGFWSSIIVALLALLGGIAGAAIAKGLYP